MVIPLRYSPTWCAWISSRCLLHNMRWSIAPRFTPRACWTAIQQVLSLDPQPPTRRPSKTRTVFGILSSVSRRRASICRWSPTHGKDEGVASDKRRHAASPAGHNSRPLIRLGSCVRSLASASITGERRWTAVINHRIRQWRRRLHRGHSALARSPPSATRRRCPPGRINRPVSSLVWHCLPHSQSQMIAEERKRKTNGLPFLGQAVVSIRA